MGRKKKWKKMKMNDDKGEKRNGTKEDKKEEEGTGSIKLFFAQGL